MRQIQSNGGITAIRTTKFVELVLQLPISDTESDISGYHSNHCPIYDRTAETAIIHGALADLAAQTDNGGPRFSAIFVVLFTEPTVIEISD